MKKITTVLMAICLGLFAAHALNPADAGIITNAKYEITPEGRRIMNSLTQRQLCGAVEEGDQTMTRSFIDNAGNVWNLSVLLTQTKICDIVHFQDDVTGEIVYYGFDRLPYYVCNFLLYMADANTGDLTSYVTFVACWPSYYIYEQIFSYKGELNADGSIPEKYRDYAPVTMTQLANDPDFTNNFREAPYIGSDIQKGTTKFEFWTLLENAMDSSGGTCTINKEEARTMCTDTMGSSFVFTSYDNETSEINSTITLYYTFLSTGRNSTSRLKYAGTARVEGFEEINVDLPEFGDLHLFNTGSMSSDSFGDLNPFTDVWGPFTGFYMAIGDKNMIWEVDTTAPVFAPDVIKENGIMVEPAELDAHANKLFGYLFADPKYSADPTLDPASGDFKCIWPFEGEEDGIPYTEIVPYVNTFTPSGYSYDSWSDEYGVLIYVENFPDLIAANSRIGWGMTSGFRASIGNSYKKTVNAQSTGKVIYHYNPEDLAAVREFSLVGDGDWDAGVEGVMISTAIVTASNGVISVEAGAPTDVAIYSLDGVCLLRKAAAQGETVSLEAPKGIYVVNAEGRSVKVVL